MAGRHDLSLAEGGALALADAAARLDSAADAETFLQALEHNRQVWKAIKEVAARQNWPEPHPRVADYALATAGKMGLGLSDDDVHALIDINRRVSARLAGGDIERIRERAYFIWENLGRPHGKDLDHWLIAELEMLGGGRGGGG